MYIYDNKILFCTYGPIWLMIYFDLVFQLFYFTIPVIFVL